MDLSGWLFLGLCNFLCVVLILWYFFRLNPVKGVPYPPMHPWLGHFPLIVKWHARLWDQEVKLLEENGATFQLVVPGRPRNLRTANPANIKHMLSDNADNYVKNLPGEISFVEEFLGKGIFAVDGDEAREQRKTASHMFSTRVLRDHMVASFLHHGRVLCGVLSKIPPDTVVDMQDYLLRFTMDSFCNIAFGVNLNSLTASSRPSFAWAFDEIQVHMKARQLWPTIVWTLQRKLQLSKSEVEIRRCQKILHEFVDSVIAERESSELMSEKSHDILALFLKQAKKNNQPMDRAQLRDVMLNFMIAGRDTTGCLLTWALVEFHRHPEWEEKCVAEIEEVLGGEEPNHDNVKRLSLLHMFLSEVLRLHPPVPTDTKRALKDDVWPDGTVVPAGTHCTYHPYGAGRLASNWGADALEFNPNRWSHMTFENVEEKKNFDFKFITFNAGPRICLGKSMAYMEAKVCLGQLLPKFKFRLKDGADMSYKISIILQLKNGLPMTITPR